MQTKSKILLCVTGGIAAYKAIDLASRLHKAGYSIQTVLTEDARRFVSPINFAGITHAPVHDSLWTDPDPIPHISLADWADLIVVAPATANTLAKAAHGIADNLLSATLLAHRKPILWVPAMNVNMYQNPATQANMKVLIERGHHILEPETGTLACAYEGQGKYPPNQEIIYGISTYLSYGRDLKGKKVMITAGATEESIDPMRMITNRSSGKMGIALARALALRGAEVSLIYGSVREDIPYYLKDIAKAETVDAMHKEVMFRASQMDWIIKCAAVSDYRPVVQAKEKIKKGGPLLLELGTTPDILCELGRAKGKHQKLVGFAAETENLILNAREKIKKKNLDLIVCNHLSNVGKDTNSISLLTGGDEPLNFEGNKFDLAHLIIDKVKAL